MSKRATTMQEIGTHSMVDFSLPSTNFPPMKRPVEKEDFPLKEALLNSWVKVDMVVDRGLGNPTRL